MQSHILIIDDEKKLNNLLTRIIELENYKVSQAFTAKEGLRIIGQEDIMVIISDVKLPDANGVELVKKLKEIKPYCEVICLTAYGTIPDGVMAIKNGAFDYITKGDDNDRIIPLISKAIDKAVLQHRLFEYENRLIKSHSFESIIGTSKTLKQAIDLARKVAETATTVLLLGETGTGKEVFARAIHYNGPRRHKNFVAVNCSAFNQNLLESELFGYKAGAFTGASKDKKGLFEEADGGTLFLDEIGETNIDMQAKLLRVLESGEFIKVGDTRLRKVDVRLIAATNRALELELDKGNFRKDLFYRLSIFSIMLPSLNERSGDIQLLAEHYLKDYSSKSKRHISGMSPGFIRQLVSHTWKGNIRELKNLIERTVIIADSDQLTVDLLPFNFTGDQNAGTEIFEMSAMEKKHISHILKYANGNKTEAARLLNIGLTTLYRKIDEYHLG